MTSTLNSLSLVTATSAGYVSSLSYDHGTWEEHNPPRVAMLTQLLVSSIFGAVMSETGEIRDELGIFSRYATTAIDRISSGVDTGLVYGDTLPLWQTAHEDEQRSIATAVVELCDKCDDFPDVSTMNVVGTMMESTVDVGKNELTVLIPALVSSSRGINAIIPTIAGGEGESALYANLSPIPGIDISQVHLWNLNTMTISKAQGDIEPLGA